MKKLALIILMLMLPLVAFGATGQVLTKTIDLTASVANYWPQSTGFDVSEYQYFGFQFICEETTGATPNATVTLEVSNDQSTWTAYTQVVFYPLTAVASASLAWTAETAQQGSIHPAPCRYMRVVVTETGAESDITFTGSVFFQ